MLDAMFSWVGVLAVAATIVCAVDSRATIRVACALAAFVEAKRAFRECFLAAFRERLHAEARQQQSS